MNHTLNLWPEHYTATTLDVPDVGYQPGDLLHLREWEPGGFGGPTGRHTTRVVTHVHRADGRVTLTLARA